MNQPDSKYPDLEQPDSSPLRRRVVSALASVYAEGRAPSSLDASVLQAVEAMSGAGCTTAHVRKPRLILFGAGMAAAAIVCAVAIGAHVHSPGNPRVAHSPLHPPVAAVRGFLNRAAVALPPHGRVLRLAYIQFVGNPTRAQNVYVWQGAVPGGYQVVSSSTADGTSNVAEVRLRGRMRQLARPVPALGVLDGPGDARMLRATLARSPGNVQITVPRHLRSGRRIYAVRLRVSPHALSSGSKVLSHVWFYYDAGSAVLVAAKGDGWSVRLAGREVIPFYRAPQLIRRFLRPDISAIAPAY